MKLGTRLLVSLLSTVTLITVAYAVWTLIEIQATLAPQSAIRRAITTTLALLRVE